MNLVLFAAGELATPLDALDPRAQHILKVLRRAPGDTFIAGLVGGPHGIATLVAIQPDGLRLHFAPTHESPPLAPISLLIGLPRPQTARDLLRDATTLGVAALHFVATTRTDSNYATSSLWTSGEWRRHLLAGAAQACDTRLPEVTWNHSLKSSIPMDNESLVPSAARLRCFALDNYEATCSLASALAAASGGPSPALSEPTCLAFGPERGWAEEDRVALRAAGFTLCSLGTRVLRLETAVVAALALLHFSNPSPRP